MFLLGAPAAEEDKNDDHDNAKHDEKPRQPLEQIVLFTRTAPRLPSLIPLKPVIIRVVSGHHD
jgi:hypothetical protein